MNEFKKEFKSLLKKYFDGVWIIEIEDSQVKIFFSTELG